MVKGKNAIKIILMTILSFVGLLFFTYNNLNADELAGCFSFQDNRERLITTKGSGWGEGFTFTCEEQNYDIINYSVEIDNKNNLLGPTNFNNGDGNAITRLQNHIRDQVINGETGYYKLTYKITYELDGIEKTDKLIKEITVLDPGLSDNNNIFDTSIVWGGDLLGSESGRLNASTPYLERNEDGEYIGMGKTIVVGNINSDDQSYIAVVDNYGKFYGNAFLYNFGRAVDNPDGYPTVINAIEYSGRENAGNSIYWIIGRYQEASKWKPFMSRVIWNDVTSSFELDNNEEWGDYVPSGYDSGEFLSMIVHVKKDIDENYSTYPVVTGYFQNAFMQKHGAILKFNDELGKGIIQFEPVIPVDLTNVNSNFEFRSIIWTNEEQTKFAVVGYRTNVKASSDSAGILREYLIDEGDGDENPGSLILQEGKWFDSFLYRRDDVPYRTQFNDVIKDGDKYIIVGSTTYSDGNSVIHSGGTSDGLILIVNYVNPGGAGQRIITYGTGADGEKLNSISLTNDTRADGYDYVAVGKLGNKGFIIEIKKEIATGSISFPGSGTNYAARTVKTKNAGTGSELHNLYLSNNNGEERSDYFVLGSFTAADYIEGLGTSSGGFLFLNYQNGSFKKPVTVIEVNYGYDDPGNGQLTDEDIIRQIIGDNLSLRYDGVFHNYSGENSIRILETGSYTNVYTFAYFNNSKTGVYIPITINVVNLAAAPQVSSSTVSGFKDSFAIPMYYTYNRVVNQPTDPGTTKVDPGTGVHDLYNYKPLFSYEFERNLHPIGSLYYKDDKGEFISIEPENEKNIRKVKYSIIEEEISPGTVCFNKDDFGDYIKSSTDCKMGVSYSASDSEVKRNNHASTVENNPPLVYLTNDNHYNVYSREEVYERINLVNMKETETYYYRDASDRYWITATKPYDTYNEYYRRVTTAERAKQQLTANFNIKESAHQFALFQEMLRVRKVPVNQITLGEGNNFTINGFTATVNYYPGELTKIRDGNRHIVQNVYVYYIDLGSVSPSVPKTCAADTSCTNYGGYAFSSLAEVEKAAKEFISGKKSEPFIRYTERTSPSQYSNSVLQEANNHFYKDEVNTFAYYQNLNFPMISGSRNLTLKVWKNLSAKEVKEMNFDGAKVFHRETREEYIGLETSFDKNTFSFGKNGDEKSEGLYTVQYCYAYTKNCGEPKSFYLDYSAPVLGYSFANKVKKDFLVINDIEYIKNKITINSTNVSDNHDEYMVITYPDNVYKEQMDATFEYQGEDKHYTITVSDRAGNTHTYNFIIGGIAPTIQINNKTLKSFEVDITVGNEEEVRNSIIENGISVYFTPFGSQRIRDTQLEAFINRLITDMDEESVSVQLSMSLDEFDEGIPIQIGDEEEDNILTYIPQMGYYEFRITDIFGNSPYRDAGLGLRDLELDFYEEGDFSDDNERDVKAISYNFKENDHTFFVANTDYYIKIDKSVGDDYYALYGAKYVVRDHYVFSNNYIPVQESEIGQNKKSVIEYYLLNEEGEFVKDDSADPISFEHFIKEYVPVDLNSVGELKDGNVEYAFKVYDNEVGNYFVVDTVIKVHNTVNVDLYLVSEINTGIDGLIEYSSLPRFDASGYDIELPPEVGNIDYYINNEDSYVRFSFDKYTYIRINQYNQDEYGFIGNSNVCQFKIVGSEYNQDIEDPEERGSICNEDMVFKFLVFDNFTSFYNDFIDKQTTWDDETLKRTYAIVKHEENGVEEVSFHPYYLRAVDHFDKGTNQFVYVDDLTIQTMLKMFGFEIVHIGYERNNDETGNLKDYYFYLKFNGEGIFNFNIKTTNNSRTLINKALIIDKTPPVIVEIVEDIEENYEEAQGVLTPSEINRYYVKDEEATEGSGYYLDEFYYINENHYILNAYDVAELDDVEEDETRYIKAGGLYIPDLLGNSGQKFVLRYDPVDEGQYGELKDLSISYFYEHAGEFVEDKIDQSIESPQRYIRRRIENQDIRLDFSLENVGTRFDTASAIEFGDDGRTIRIEANVANTGTHIIIFRDMAGNTTEYIGIIDAAAPEISLVRVDEQTQNVSEYISRWSNDFKEVEIQIREENLDISSLKYYFEYGEDETSEVRSVTEDIEEIDTGVYRFIILLSGFDNTYSGDLTLNLESSDMFYNSSSMSWTFKYDNIAPELEFAQGYEPPTFNIDGEVVGDFVTLRAEDYQNPPFFCIPGPASKDNTTLLYNVQCFDEPGRETLNIEVFEHGTNNKFVFAGEYPVGVKVDLVAEDAAGNRSERLTTIIKINDSNAPYMEKPINGGSRIITNEEEVTITFNEIVMKYYCIFILDGNQEDCQGVESYAPAENIGYSKGNNTYYIRIDDGMDVSYIVDNGNIIVQGHYIRNEFNVFELIGSGFGEDKLEQDYYLLKEEVIYFNLSPEGDYILSEDCLDTCYTLTTQKVEELIEGETYYYYIEQTNTYKLVGEDHDPEDGIEYEYYQIIPEEIVFGSNEVYGKIGEDAYGVFIVDDGSIVLPAHYTKENYARYGFNEGQREFTLTYNGDAHITYIIWVEDFAGNRSQNIEVTFDREAPKVDIEVDKVVIREAYSGNSYNQDNIDMSDNFDSLPHLNITGGFPYYYRYTGQHLPTFEIDDILNSFLNFAFIRENHYVISYFKVSEELIGTAIEPGQNYYILQNGSFVKDNENTHVSEHHYIKGYELVDPSSVGNIKNPNIDYYFCNEEDVCVLDNTWKGARDDYFATSWGIYIVAYRIQDRAGNFSEITKDSLRVVIYHDTNLPSLTVEKIPNTLPRCEDGNCYVSFNVSDLRIIMNSDAAIAGDENRIIKDEFGNIYDLLENQVTLTSPEYLQDGENTIVITDKGYYVNRTTYFINGRIDKRVSGSGFVAYNEVECIDNSEESECDIADAGFIRDYNKYNYYIVIENYEAGKLEPVSVRRIKDNGTLIMPGHRRDQTGYPLIEDSTLFATPKIRGTNYYIKDENQENIVDSDFRSFIWVENKTTFTFTVDNKAPIIENSEAIIEDGDYHFEIIVDDISARVAYVKNGSNGDIIIQSGETRADGSGVYAEIYEGKLRVVFTGDGSYSNVRAIDIAGNTSTPLDFIIDNTPPLENYNNVKDNAIGINFWYAVPSVRSGNNLNLYKNAPVFDPNIEYYPLFDEDGAILTNFNNEQFFAFQTYSKALEYLLNLYLIDQANEQYHNVYSQQQDTSITLSNSAIASQELAKWVYPVYTGNILYGDDLVKHGSTSEERVFLSDYVHCGPDIGNYCGNQFNIPAMVIIGNSPTITLTPEEDGLITMYYNGVSLGPRSGEFQLNSGEGIYIFQERDNAKKPDTDNNAYNYSYYAIIVKREMYSASGEKPGFIQYKEETNSEKVIEGHYIKTGGTYVPVSDPVGSDKAPGVTYYLRNTRNITYGEIYFEWKTNTDVYLNLPISMLDNKDLEERIALSYLIVEVKSRTSGAASWTSRNILGADFFECVLEDTTTVCHPKPYLFELGYNHIITISDRYGRELIFDVSLSETLPEIEITNLNYGFAKGVKITDSELTRMNDVELEFSEDINTTSYKSVEVLTIMTLRQFLSSIRNGSSGQLHVLEENTEALKGYYRIRIYDDHGNVSSWTEFTFNPVVVEMTLDFNINFNHYMSGEHVITNQEVTIKWNDSENDLKIYRNGLLVNLPSNYPGKGTEDASISLDNPGLNFGEGNGIDGTYTFEIINRFDTGRVTNRIYHDALYALDNGDYILGEHYIANGDKYDPVPISDYGKEKDPSQTYYFLTKEGDYVIDNGSYVSRLHYVNTAGVYNRVDEQYISTEKAGHGRQFFIKRSFTSLEIDRIKPSGYEENTHIIYPGVVDGRNVIDATKEYIYGDGRLGQIGEKVTLVNKNVRVAWYTDEPGTSDIRYICYEVRLHGDLITNATCINNFKVIEEENYAYYDFLYTSQLAAGVEITFWLRDFAGNEKDVEQRSKFVLDVEITRATISGRDLTEIPENYITNQPHIILEILNEGAVYSSGHFYMPVQVGVPYLTGITYYTRNSSGGYSPIPQRPELTGEGNYVRLNVEYALIDVKTHTTIESGIYENYINKLAGIRDRISDNVELTFTITNPLMGEYRRIDNNASSHRHHVKQYSITIDIFAPEIRINRDNYVEVDGAFGNNLYRGTLTIALESGAKGFLCKLNYETNVCTNEIEFMEGYTIPNLASNSGKYSYYTRDAVGNASELYLFEIDNITPWFNFINQSDSLPVSEGGFTNASNIDISVSDNILNDKITLEYQLWPPGATTYGEWIGQSVNTYSFTQQGRYKVRIKDVAGNVSPVRSFIIDRSTPEVKFMTSGDTGTREMYNGEIILSDQHPFSITWNDAVQTGNAAPITKVLVNGVLYKKGDLIPASIPTGEEEEEIIYRYGKTGEFDIVVTDLAGNISRYRKVIRNSNYICLNGQIVNVKAQYMFRGNNITFGIDKEFRFNSNDVVLFAIPMSSSNDTCSFTNYKMLDSRSFYEVRDDYATINNSGESGMKYVLDSSYSSKIELNNSYVYAFVIEREVAEVDLQLPVDRFFFFEDPIGWSIIFALGALILYSIIRVMFVRRKAKLL